MVRSDLRLGSPSFFVTVVDVAILENAVVTVAADDIVVAGFDRNYVDVIAGGSVTDLVAGNYFAVVAIVIIINAVVLCLLAKQ